MTPVDLEELAERVESGKKQRAFHFECRACLKPIAICGPMGERLWCEAHCPDHQFTYRPELRETRCDNCETLWEHADA